MTKICLLLLTISLIGLSGCGRFGESLPGADRGKPDDFSVILDWSAGPLPDPWMYYSYSIRIDSTGEGWFHYRSGDNKAEFGSPFPVSEDELNALYLFCRDKGAFSVKREAGDPLDGAPDVHLTIKVSGREYSYGPLSELSERERTLAEAIVSEIEALVPGDYFMKMNQLQLEHEMMNQ